MVVDPIKEHWQQGGLVTMRGDRLFFIPFRCLMDMPEKER
jgi:hypothetical protein